MCFKYLNSECDLYLYWTVLLWTGKERKIGVGEGLTELYFAMKMALNKMSHHQLMGTF